MPHSIEYILGEISGELKALREAFEDERKLRRQDSKIMLERFDDIDHLANLVEIVQGKLENMRSQTYSNKSEGEKAQAAFRSEIARVDLVQEGFAKALLRNSQIYTRLLGVSATFFSLGGAICMGVYWVITNWSQVFPFLRGLNKP